jgi:hypothetical protein
VSPKDPSPRRFRDDFRQSRWIGVRVRPTGFMIDDDLHLELRGRVISTVRIRKLFEDGVLSCHSPDGERSHQGTLCETCAHPACRALLRVQIENGNLIYILDLPHSSAGNLIRLADDLAERKVPLATATVIASVVDRGHWGEVRFRVD